MAWWGWIVFGAALLAAEMAVQTDFYLTFLGLSALVTGVVVAVGLREPVWLQWAIFGAFSVASLLLFRRKLGVRFRVQGADPRVEDTLLGEVALVTDPIAPGATGRVELRGSTWTGRNADERLLAPGTRTRVVRVEGLLLHVRRES